MKKKYVAMILGAVIMAQSFPVTCTIASAQQTAVHSQVSSYLTGEEIPENIGRRRPVAVMLGNCQDAAPQSGISKAGVIYEAPVEGGITRLMAVIEDYDSLEKLGSVRSCRDYYLFYATEFDAVYAHFGQSVYALTYLQNHDFDNLNGLNLDGDIYFRTKDRNAPHNAYLSGNTLTKGMEQFQYRKEYKDDYSGHYLFASDGTETLLEDGITANVVKLDNFTYNHPWFEYDASTGKYKRFQFGNAHIDELTGEQLECDNIILQYSSWENYDANGYLNIDTMSGGAGKYITRGKAIDIRWEKDSPWGITHYYDANEQEIHLNQGKTWVEIVLNDTADAVNYQ